MPVVRREGKSQDLALVGICDFSSKKIEKASKDYNVKFYSEFNEMLDSDIDAVVLANYFHQHAPFAIKAMEAGKHVLSETTPAGTMAEAVMLCEAVEKTGMTYMFAENYPFTKMGLAMKKEFESGSVGNVVFAEGEYIHPIEANHFNKIAPGINHWRNWIPSTYYSTHALAPLMFMTGLKPIRVNALSIANENVSKGTARRNDPLAIILCTMNDGSVFRITGWGTAGGHSVRYRIMGEYGTIESPRQYEGGYFGNGQLNIILNELRESNKENHMYSYTPEWPADSKDAQKSGHGGGDYFMNKMFAEAIRSGTLHCTLMYMTEQQCLQLLYLVGEVRLKVGKPYDIPDFKIRTSREKYQNDLYSLLSQYGLNFDLWFNPSIYGERIPSEDDIQRHLKIHGTLDDLV